MVDTMKRPVQGFGPHLLKGINAALGIEMDYRSLIEAANMAEEAFREAVLPAARGYATDVDWKKVSPEFAPALMKLSSPDQMVQLLAQNMQLIAQSIQKDISLTSPITTGLVPFDLEAPAKLQYPLGTPLRNKIPRTRGQGVAHRFKRITAITGSQQNFSNSIFINELPGGSFNSLNFPPAISLTGVDGIVNYAYMGQGNNAGLLTELAGRGFEDIEALLTLTLLQSMMLQEEGAMLYGRFTSQLAAPGSAPTGTSQTPGTAVLTGPTGATFPYPNNNGQTAITGLSTHLYVKVTTVSGMGESAGSSASSAVSPSGSQDVALTWPDVTGAVGYNVYVSTGSSDPGDSARYFAGYTPCNAFELSGALPTSGVTVPTQNTTQATNGYDGFIATTSGTGNVSAGAGGSVSRLNAGWSVGGYEIQTVFKNMWNAVRARPQEVWMSGPDRLNFSRQLLKDSTGVGAYRVNYDRTDAGTIAAGQVVASIWNETTGDEVPLTVHPWMYQGNVFVPSYQIPYPNSSTPNVWENVMVQDYLGLAFPNIDLARRFAIIMYGALVCYAPIYNGILQGVVANQ